MTTAAKVIEEVRAMQAGQSNCGLRDSATPDRLEVGDQAHLTLSHAAGWWASHSGRLLPALYGLPVVQVEPSLDLPRQGYRVFNRAGAVIAAGDIDP